MTSTSCSSDSLWELWLELTVEVEHSDTERLLWIASTWVESNSRRRFRYLCSRRRFSRWELAFRSFSSRALMKILALLRSPNVVWRELSPPKGTMSFSFSRQFLRWARRFFSSSLWVDLFPWGFLLLLDLISLLILEGLSSPLASDAKFVRLFVWVNDDRDDSSRWKGPGRLDAYPCSTSLSRLSRYSAACNNAAMLLMVAIIRFFFAVKFTRGSQKSCTADFVFVLEKKSFNRAEAVVTLRGLWW